MKPHSLLQLGVAFALEISGGAASPQNAPKPNLIFFLADDYGWANFGLHRRGETGAAADQARAETHTHNLEALADEGVVLERHYTFKICSPSRSALQSGRLPVHVNTVNAGVTVMNESDPVSGWAGIPRNMTGMAQKLRQAGYSTHMVGKWDAGMATPEHTPWGRGYDTWTGYFQHANDYWGETMPFSATGEVDSCLNRFRDFFMHNDTYRGGVQDSVSASPECKANRNSIPGCFEEYAFKERALAVIRQHDNQAGPMFLFYAFHLVHTPLQVPQLYLDKIDKLVAAAGGKPIDSQQRRLLAAMILYMDEVVGEVVEAVKAKGMWDSTLIVFSADNGGAVYEPAAGNNHPLRGSKFSDFEGGIRTNAFVSGGFVPQHLRGTNFSGVISVADWYGTFCELAGVDAHDAAAEEANQWLAPRGLPTLRGVDSVPQWGFILNGTNGRQEAFHLSEQAILEYPFKLIMGKQPYGGWQGEVYPNCTTVSSYKAGKGPDFTDIKAFNVPLYLHRTQEEIDASTWVHDCSDGCLFDVDADPNEHVDLARKRPDIAKSLREKLAKLNNHNFNPGRGEDAFVACEVAIEKGGFYGPFAHIDGWYSPPPRPSLKKRLENEALRATLKAVNTKAFEDVTLTTVKWIMPLITRSKFVRSQDICLSNGTDDVAAELAEDIVV